MGKPLTARQAGERYGVHRTTILYWHTHGWINADGHHQHLPALTNPAGEPLLDRQTGARLFDECDLVIAEQQTRAKAQRSHRRSRRLIPA